MISVLSSWKCQIEVFTYNNLSRSLPSDGFFAKPTPPCFLPKPTNTTGGPYPEPIRSRPDGRQSDEDSRLRRQREQRDRDQERRSQRDRDDHERRSQRDRDHERDRDRGREGEFSRRGRKARGPLLLIDAASATKPIHEIMEEVNRGRADADRVKGPACKIAGRGPNRPICFRYCSSDGQGCTNSRCQFHHIDLSEPNWIRDKVPDTFLPNLLAFLDTPEVARHYKATPGLRTFLGSGR
jgi:hypothetical protein